MIRNLRDIIALVESGWHHVPVLVVGDVMLDKYVWGEVERISPEAPVPVVRATVQNEKPGGAANVAMNLANLGAGVKLVGFAGHDSERDRLQSQLTQSGIEAFLLPVPAMPTTTKLRVLSGHQQMFRLDTEMQPAFSDADYSSLLDHALAVLPDASVVVLSDYAKGVLTASICQAIIGAARKRGIPVLVDPKRQDFSFYRGATAICPNRKELAAAMGQPADDLDRLLSIAQSQMPSLDVECIAVTLGEKGIAVLRRDSCINAPAVVRQVYDVSGAGDTVAAVLALAIACGIEMEDAAQVANVAAGIVVRQVGTVAIRREELLGALDQQTAMHMDEKVLPLDRLLIRLTAWRSAGEAVVFTNGCFDLLHIGHIQLLEEARRQGNRLIVGLNSDDSVRQLKGPGRPLVPERERARVLAALSAVDAVVVFEESTPLRLIEAIRPDVLVKGGDYTEENVIGASEVRSWGGRVDLIPLVEGISTTGLIAKSAANAASESICEAVPV